MTRDDTRLDLAVLARLHTVGKGRPTPRSVTSDLQRFGATGTDEAEVTEACHRLLRGGLVDDALRTGDDATPYLCGRLGNVQAGITWKKIADELLPALGLDLGAGDDGRACLRKREQLAPAIVARSLGWWQRGRAPTMAKVGSRLAWEGLGLRGSPKPTPPEIRALFASKLLGVADLTEDRAMFQLAARAVGAVRADLVALRNALVGRWLEGSAWRPLVTPTTTAPPATTSPRVEPSTDAFDLAAFAEAVRRAASTAHEGRFGDHKVFIAAVWRLMRGHPPVGEASLEAFKSWLVAAHRAGLLVLHRADLPSVMDQVEVATSETQTAGGRYHFVEREALP